MAQEAVALGVEAGRGWYNQPGSRPVPGSGSDLQEPTHGADLTVQWPNADLGVETATDQELREKKK